MEVFEAVATRHSYRGPFKDQRIPQDDLRRIVQAGIQAPSGYNRQTTTFIIVDDPNLLTAMRELHATSQAMRQAQAYILCLNDKHPEATSETYSFQIEDYAAAAENMLLAVTALGYATVWVDGWLRSEGRAQKIGKLLGVPEEKVVRVILPIGIPTEVRQQKEKKPFEERAWVNRYGAN